MAGRSPEPEAATPTLASRLVGWGVFLVTIALFQFASIQAGVQAMGVTGLVAVVLQQRTGRIPYGWEGRPPSGYVTGWPAVFLSLLVASMCVGMIVWPEVAMGIFGWDRAEK